MVTTRGKQPVATIEPAAIDGVTAGGSASHPDATANNSTDNGGNTPITSRLRKRRRTGSTPADGSSVVTKRPNVRQTASPETKRENIERTSQSALAAINPKVNGRQRTTSNMVQQAPVPPTPQPAVDHVSQPVGEASQSVHNLQAHSASTSNAPDLAAVIASIIDHGENVDSHFRGYSVMGVVDTESFLPLGASLHLKTQSLPILDNLATQILNTLAKSSYQEILTIATDPDSEPGQAYATLKSLFDHTKKVYSIAEPFLSSFDLGLLENAHAETIRKANMATFVSSVFGSQDVGFFHLNEYFLDTFVANGNRLLKSQAQLFLDLKTQAYISAVSHGERSREGILEDLFPEDLEDRLLSRRPGAKQPAPSEADFLQRARNRSKSLLEESNSKEAIATLPDKYVWEDFLRDISSYVSKNFVAIVGASARKSIRGRPPNFPVSEQSQTLDPQNAPSVESNPPPDQQEIQQASPIEESEQVIAPEPFDTDEIAEKAARAAQYAMQGFGSNQDASGPPQDHQQMAPHQLQYQFEHQPNPQYYPQQYGQGDQANMGQQAPSFGDQVIPYPTQSAPTHVLYARARQAATAKASPTNRRAGIPSQRRPWTTEEENSLMAGLDRVKGPHWSQILAMFGPGGTINETLKDRNQVQLKDKARNLKLFFLKSGIEVPYYLQFVTGELKTRAPAQAAKNEAKEAAQSNENRAHLEGVMTLAGGLQSGEENGNGENDVTDADAEGDTVMEGDGPEHTHHQPMHHGGAPIAQMQVHPEQNHQITTDVQDVMDPALGRAIDAALQAGTAHFAPHNDMAGLQHGQGVGPGY